LAANDPFLSKLLIEDGLSEFQKPAADQSNRSKDGASQPKADTNLRAHFSIDRANARIKCDVEFLDPDKRDAEAARVDVSYPSYDPKAPLSGGNFVEHPSIAKSPRISDFLQSVWRSFCRHDLLSLHVHTTIHPDETMSLQYCSGCIVV
jgi:hypothetical protein